MRARTREEQKRSRASLFTFSFAGVLESVLIGLGTAQRGRKSENPLQADALLYDLPSVVKCNEYFNYRIASNVKMQGEEDRK